MATYKINGYYGADLLIEGGGSVLSVGSRFMVKPTWDVSTDVRTFTITDDDAAFGGDGDANEVGSDANQTVTVTNAAGTTVASGRVYIESSATLIGPNGTVIKLYTVEVGGVVVGVVTSAPLQPGVTYQVSSIDDVTNANAPTYASMHSASYDPDLANSIAGGDYNDSIEAGAGNDTVTGGAGNNTANLGEGNDSYGSWDQSGNDTVYGGAGNDTIIGAGGNDVLYGGSGADNLTGGAGSDTLYGGADNDWFSVTSDHDRNVIWGGETGSDWDGLGFYNWNSASGIVVTFDGTGSGSFQFSSTSASGEFHEIEVVAGTDYNDTIDASADAGGVQLWGNDGQDSLLGGSGRDTLYGGSGNDTLWGGDGGDIIYGDAGSDVVNGGAGDDILYGGTGNDTVHGGDGADIFGITAGDGADSIYGGEGGKDWDTFWFYGSDGVTVILTGSEQGTYSFASGGSGSFWEIEAIDGTSGADSMDASAATSGIDLYGGGGNDTLTGGSGHDWLEGGAGNDLLTGGAGWDGFDGGAGNDTVYGGADGDDAMGGDGDDSLFGGTGNDTLRGGGGRDTLDGGADADILKGGDGDDRLTGGAGNDTMTGGAGSDVFVLADGSGSDVVADFDMGDPDGDGRTADRLDVSGLTDADGNPVDAWDVRVLEDRNGNAVLVFPNGESVTLLGVKPSQVDSAPERFAMGIPCFAAGTPIATPGGPRPVESIAPGDPVATPGGPLPAVWSGSVHLGPEALAARPGLRPIRIARGALGNDADLLVSPQHGVLLGAGSAARLVRARHLAELGCPGVRAARGVRSVTYHHLLLPRHAIVCAAGLATESLYPGPVALAAFPPRQRLEVAAALRTCVASRSGGPDDRVAGYGPRAAPLARRREAADLISRLIRAQRPPVAASQGERPFATA